MRVLQFVSTLNRNSGVMRVIMNYYAHMDRDNIQFDFLYFIESEDSYIDEIHALGGRTFFVSKPGSSIKSLKELVLFFKQYGKDYLWLHNHESYLTFFLYFLAKKNGIKNVAVHAHLTKYSDKTLSAIRNRILCIPIKYLPVNKMACSCAAGKFLYGNVENVYLMKNMVDANRYIYDAEKRTNLRKQLNISEQEFVIGHVGRFELQKNHKFLLKMFKAFNSKVPQSKLLMVGSGVLEQEVKELVRTEGLEQKTIFVGHQKDVTSYLNAMDVFVLPSLFEGLPMVALEAQANGLPCVLADTITEETSITDNVSFCSLENYENWINKLRDIKNYKYNRQLTDTEKQKMDMNILAFELEQYYKNGR